MDEAAQQLEATYSATEDDLIEMNEHLDAVNAIPEGLTAALPEENGCELPEVDPALAVAAFALREVHAGLFGAARIAADFGGQNFVVLGHGGNTRSIAIAFDAIALVANFAYITVDELHKIQSRGSQAALANCVSQSVDELAALKSQILALQVLIQAEHTAIRTNDNTNKDTIVDNLENVRAELVNLLNTPQGRRDGFPIK
jgi:flagellin-specific chaperone FliS